MPGTVPQLHVITSASVIARPDFLSIVRHMQTACGSRLAVHLRAAELPARSLYTAATAVTRGASVSGGWCVVNGRLDVGLAAGAQAVQLGRPALGVARARRVVGSRLLLGASVHAADEAVEAARDGANYLILGTIHPTPSHPGRRAAGPGLIGVTRTLLDDSGFARVGIVAIGGIEATNLTAVLAAGATGVAVQRAVWAAADPVAAARRLASIAERQGQEAS